MANVKIEDLGALTTLADDDLIPVWDESAGITKYITVANNRAATVAPAIVAAAAKATPVDADSIGIVDSEASNVLKETTFTQLKAFLKTYYDTVYTTAAAALSAAAGIKLDDFAAPDDNTDRDATTSLHGLMPKLDKTKLDGIEALADVTDGANVAAAIVAAAAKTTPVDADSIGIIDSEASNVLKETTWTQVKAFLKTYFDTLYTTAAAAIAAVKAGFVLDENASIGLDPAGSADGKYTGITVTGLAGYSQAFGDLVYLDPTDSRWEAVDANAAAAGDGDARGLLGMVVVAGTDGNACTILLSGIIRADAKFPDFTVNNPIYASETAGIVTQTQPTTTDVVIRVVGAALTTQEMFFRPDSIFFTHT